MQHQPRSYRCSPSEWWSQMWPIRVEWCQRNSMIPRDNPVTVGVFERELLDASKSPWGPSTTRQRVLRELDFGRSLSLFRSVVCDIGSRFQRNHPLPTHHSALRAV